MTNDAQDRAESAPAAAVSAAEKKTKTSAAKPAARKTTTKRTAAGSGKASGTAKKAAAAKDGAQDAGQDATVAKSTAQKAPAKSAAKKTPAKTATKSVTEESAAETTAKTAQPAATKKTATKRTPAKSTATKATTGKTAAAKAAPADAKEAPAAEAAPAKPTPAKPARKTSSTAAEKPAAGTKAVAEESTGNDEATPKTAPKRSTAKKSATTGAKKSSSAKSSKTPAAAPAPADAAPAAVSDTNADKDAVAATQPASSSRNSQSGQSGRSSKSGGKARSASGKSKAVKPGPRSVAEAEAMLAQEKAARSVAQEAKAPVEEDAKKSSRPKAKSDAKASGTVDVTTAADTEAEASAPADTTENAGAESATPDGEQKRRRRSRRGGRRRNKKGNAAGSEAGTEAVAETAAGIQDEAAPENAASAEHDAPSLKETEATDAETASGIADESEDAPQEAKGKRASGKGKGSSRGGENARADEPAKGKGTEKAGRRKMFISILSGQQVEVVLTEEGQVQEYYVEMTHQAKIKGNIYKGVISNVDANLQAAFVSYGGVKNGFLQIDEVHPEYYQVPHDGSKGRKYPLIQKALKPGQEILVQVVKEPAGTKGAFLTSYLSLPGRFLVLTPGREQIGVSRKVDNEEERARLREMLTGLKPGPGLGVIVRTVSMGATKTSLQRDLQFLKRLWKDVRSKGLEEQSPSLIYQELDLATRAIRDYLTDEVNEVWVDNAAMADTMQEMADMLFPRKKSLVHVHKDSDQGQPLFERFSLQKQLDQIYSREVVLPSGGRLVFDNTEALTAIDINSSKSGGKNNFEDMAYRTNIEAARMIPLQLRLRDIGGQVVADFIEMRERDHWREVEKAVRNGMKGDRARYDVGKIGPFGMLEIVRQRLGSSAISVSTEPCPCCKGTGVRRNMEWQAMRALRDIQKIMRQAAAQKQETASFATESELALHLLNTKRSTLESLEKEFNVRLSITIGV